MKKVPMIALLIMPYTTLIICYQANLDITVGGCVYGTLSKAGAIVSSIAQFIPCVDVIGSILCYIMFRKEGQIR